MSNIFRNATRPLYDSPLILAIFITAVLAFIIGIVHLVEDTISSYYGYQELVESFGIVPVSFAATWVTLSLAPQIGTIISGYMYLSDTTRKKWLFAIVFFFTVDFASDLWHRSDNGKIITDFLDAMRFGFSGSGESVEFIPAFTAMLFASMFTFFAYTVGAEFFIVVGVGIIGESYVKAAEQYGRLIAGVTKAKAAIRDARKRGQNKSMRPVRDERI